MTNSSSAHSFIHSSIGMKVVMALTGILLFGFVLAHLLGNLQMFSGYDAINGYAKLLKDMPVVLWTARVGLVIVFILHIVTAVRLKKINSESRAMPYIYQNTVQASYASRTMLLTGIMVLFYVAYHLLHFTLGITHPEFFHLTDDKGRHDVYAMVVYSFQLKSVALLYIAAMAALSLHLSHGIASFFQTLGFSGPNFAVMVKRLSIALALLILVGYCSIPIAVQLGVIDFVGK